MKKKSNRRLAKHARQLHKSKKAMVFNIMIVMVTIIILTYGFIRLSAKKDVEKELGENQLEIITRIQEGEKAMIFLDSASKMAAYQAVYDLQNAGGVIENTICGDYYGFKRWNSDSGESCMTNSTQVKESFKDLMISNLVARTAAYPSADFIGNVPEAAFNRGAALARYGGRIYSNQILRTASKYLGFPYGKDPKQYVCVSFIEQVLKDLGIKITPDMQAQIYVRRDGKTSTQLVETNDPRIRGVELALVNAGIGQTVSIQEAQPGDFVQYWMLIKGVWVGHTAIIEKIKGNGIFDILGAHRSINRVGTITVNLANPQFKVYFVRLTKAPKLTIAEKDQSENAGYAGQEIPVQDSAETEQDQLPDKNAQTEGTQTETAQTETLSSETVQTEIAQEINEKLYTPFTNAYSTELPQTLYDLIITDKDGESEIYGIARQKIAVGINKTLRKLSPEDICVPIPIERDYDSDWLKQTYGQTRQEVESQLINTKFLQKDIRIHRKIIQAVACAEREIETCEEAKSYDFRTISSYLWHNVQQPPGEMLSTSSFGISLDINSDTNINSQDGKLRSDIPRCVIDAFKRYGFRWGGDFENAKVPDHFEFMGDPEKISIISEGTLQTQNLDIEGLKCSIPEPEIDTQSIGTPRSGRVENAYAIPTKDENIQLKKHASKSGNYGTTELAYALEVAGCVLQKKYNIPLKYIDIGRQYGGPYPPHKSHQAGRSVDIRFISKTAQGYAMEPFKAVPKSTVLPETQALNQNFDIAANYEMIRWIAKSQPIRQICADDNVKRAMKEYAQKNYPGEWEELDFERKIVHVAKHHNHFHITIQCATDDTRCVR